MKRIACLFLAACAAVHAHDFRAEAPITTKGQDVFQRVQVPFEAYREARRDLADVRVLNARGDEVPLAFAGEAEREREAAQSASLPIFPISARTGPVIAAGRLDVHVRTRPDGTVISVQERPTGRGAAVRPAAYLLDASLVKYPIGGLKFDWEIGPGSEVVKVNVEASDDLAEWRWVATRAPLLRVEQGGQSLSQTRVPLNGVRAKYFRITWDGGLFVLRSVDAQSAPAVKPPERRALVVNGTRGKDGEIAFDLGARLPVEAVRVVFPETNSVTPYEVALRDAADKPWQTVTAATFYRITRDGVELTSTPVEVHTRAAREWRVKPQVGGSQGPQPSLEVLWRPAELVFVAKGDPPFTLAFGNAESRSAAIPIASLMPGYERHAERKLPLADTGPVRIVRTDSAMRSLLGDVSPRKAALWAVLLLGVAALGYMAWRLKGQMKG